MKSGKMFENFKEETDYEGKQGSFSELVSKLKAKGRIENVEYGVYDITDKGENIVEKYDKLRWMRRTYRSW